MIIGLNQKNLRQILLLTLYGDEHIKEIINGTYEKMKYVIPLQYQFETPLVDNGYDTFCLYYIERDRTLTSDSFIEIKGKTYDSNYNLAHILLRFCGGNAEETVKFFRHQTTRNDAWKYWRALANGDKMDYVGDIMPRNVFYFGNNNELGYDIRLKFCYNELIDTNWKKLEGVDIKLNGEIKVGGQE